MALIKKKDVESYFATRRALHPLHIQRKKVPLAAKAPAVDEPKANEPSALDIPEKPTSGIAVVPPSLRPSR